MSKIVRIGWDSIDASGLIGQRTMIHNNLIG